ncbi:hypothetical protein CSPX01_05434 [Colletotrichum filicis]|nr:hypothetical protein CSPX01_05434 [Colletotrichum filicis]
MFTRQGCRSASQVCSVSLAIVFHGTARHVTMVLTTRPSWTWHNACRALFFRLQRVRGVCFQHWFN